LQKEYEIRLKFVDLIGIKGVLEFYELSKIKFDPKDFGLDEEEIMNIEEMKKNDEEVAKKVDKKEEEEEKKLIKGKTKILEKSKELLVYEGKNKRGRNLKNEMKTNKKSEVNREDKEENKEESEENEENREEEEEEQQTQEQPTKNIQEGEPLKETEIIDKYGKKPIEELDNEEENKQENIDMLSSNPSSSSPPSKIILPIYFLKNEYLNNFFKELILLISNKININLRPFQLFNTKFLLG